MAGYRLPGQTAHHRPAGEIRRQDQGPEVLDTALAAPDFEQRPHHGADHVAQEAVGTDAEIPVILPALPSCQRQVGGRVTLPGCLRNRAEGGLGVRPRFLETAEIMLRYGKN